MSDWQNPDDVESGSIYIAWVNSTQLPSFWLLDKDETKKGSGKYVWHCNKTGKKIPREWIAAVAEMPNPEDIGPDWMGLNNS
jgi:hypothetical protein